MRITRGYEGGFTAWVEQGAPVAALEERKAKKPA